MRTLLFTFFAVMMLGSLKAQDPATLSGGNEPKLTGAEGLYALW